MIFLHLFLLGLFQLCSFSLQICEQLFMSSSIGDNTENDIIQAGITQNTWNIGNTQSPIISASKNLEFFYIPNLKFHLKQSDIQLIYDNEYVTSQIILKEEKGSYTIEITYQCDSYGGNLIPFRLEINIPECGGTYVGWRKLCGNPYTEREGFAIDMLAGNSKQTIVKNGKTINPSYFDEEINDYAFLIPENINSVALELYMNPDDIMDDDDGLAYVHAFRGIVQNAKKKHDLETDIIRARVDSDQNLVQTNVFGELNHSAVEIKNDINTTIELVFQCLQDGRSPVELDIVLPVFKDVSVLFVKVCSNSAGKSHLFKYFIIFLIIVVILKIFSTLSKASETNKKAEDKNIYFKNVLNKFFGNIEKFVISKFFKYSKEREFDSLKREQIYDQNEEFRDLKRVPEVSVYGTL